MVFISAGGVSAAAVLECARLIQEGGYQFYCVVVGVSRLLVCHFPDSSVVVSF